jgi:hypothetical protein
MFARVVGSCDPGAKMSTGAATMARTAAMLSNVHAVCGAALAEMGQAPASIPVAAKTAITRALICMSIRYHRAVRIPSDFEAPRGAR